LPLSTRVVLETLRLEQSEHLYRVATREIEHRGFVIPRGWLVRLCVRESHRDPAVFENPEAFDPDRFLRRTYTRREYSPFGAGLRHTCLGEGLTRLVGHVFVEEVASAYTWRTVTDGAYEYSAWRHWRPSSRWRVLATSTAALRPSGS
jgi:cytochrome P450